MQRRKLGWLAMMSAAMLALGCGGKAASTPTLVGNAPKAVAAVALDDLAYLPIDSDMIISLDAATLRQSAMYRDLVEPKLQALLASNDGIGKFKSVCGFDPFATVSSLAFGARQDSSAVDTKTFVGVVVLHGFEKQKLLPCMEKFSREPGTDASYTMDGETITVRSKGAVTGAMQFVDGKTMVLQFDAKATKATLQRVVDGSNGVKNSPAFMELYSRTAGTARFVVNGRLQGIRDSGTQVKVVFGALTVTDVLALNVALRMNSDAEATSMVNTVKPQLESLKSMVTSATADAVGTDAQFTASMTAVQLNSFMALAGLGG